MKIQGAVIKEQGVTFAIIIVKMSIVDSPINREDTIKSLSSLFPSLPIVLMALDSKGIPKYYGRTDIVKFLSNIHISQIQWKEYTF